MSLPDSLSANLRLPVICSPLFIISNPALVIAQCKAGVVGSFPALNARPLALLDEWLQEITESLAAWDRIHPEAPSAPFAVNQIVHRSNDRLEHDMEVCAKYRVPWIITSLGAREDINKAVHDWDGKVLHDVIDDRFARKAVEKGADGLIAVAAGAGGHAGRLSPFALVQELRQWFAGPLALSGAIANGQAILAAQAMGADLAYIGSLFIAAAEANADEAYKRMIVESRSEDIIYSNLFTGVHGNYLRPSIVRAGLDPDALPEGDPTKMNFASSGSTKAKAWRDIWGCGQGIGVVDAVTPADEQVSRLKQEYDAAKRLLDRNFIHDAAAHEQFVLSGTRSRKANAISERAARAAQGFRILGASDGNAVALLLRNDFSFFEASMGASLAGAYPVPINWHSTAEEAGYIVRDCNAKALVIHRDLLDSVRSGLPQDLPILVVDTPPEIVAAYKIPESSNASPSLHDWDVWVENHRPFSGPAGPDRPAVIYTSGTTGKPKGVKRLPDTTGHLSRSAAAGYGLDGDGSKTVLMNGPMYHAAPNSYARFAFQVGADLILQARFDAEELLALVDRHRITHMHMVPTMFVRLLRLPEAVKVRYDLSSLRFVVHGAAPCPAEIKRAMIDWWGPIIHEYYGASEAGLVTGLDSQEALTKPGSVGKPLPGVQIRILDEDGQGVPFGKEGDIYVHAAAAPDFTYIGDDAKRASIAVDKFVTVGDVGYLDQDGYLFLRDRRRDMIISGGVNIYSAEIEAALLMLPEIGDCAVFAIPDPEFGEAVCAYLQPSEPGVEIDPATVKSKLGRTLSRFKLPKLIEVVEQLPREDSGKIFKRKLREPYWSPEK